MTNILESLDLFEVDDTLTHYGVKGMKWGIRKDLRFSKKTKTSQEGSSDDFSGINKGRKNKNIVQPRKSNDGLVVRKQKGKDLTKLSDADLNRTLDRLRKEKEYRKLNESAMQRKLIEAGQNVAMNVVTKYASELADKQASKAIGNLTKKVAKAKKP